MCGPPKSGQSLTDPRRIGWSLNIITPLSLEDNFFPGVLFYHRVVDLDHRYKVPHSLVIKYFDTLHTMSPSKKSSRSNVPESSLRITLREVSLDLFDCTSRVSRSSGSMSSFYSLGSWNRVCDHGNQLMTYSPSRFTLQFVQSPSSS